MKRSIQLSMKQFLFLISIVLISAVACDMSPQDDFEHLDVNENCVSYIPFYEQQDSNTTSLWIECICQDSIVDLGSKLVPYTAVEIINFNCDASQFDLIPTMPSVTHLTSEVTTANIQAFPNLEVFQNRSQMKGTLAPQLIFLPKLRELILFNVTNFSSVIDRIPLDVFKMTFEDTESQKISLPSNLNTLINLKELVIRNINTAVFSGYEDLVGLERLSVSDVLWVRIPETPNQWPELKMLDVRDVSLRGNLPDIFADMGNLEIIYIGGTPLSTTTFRNLTKAPNLKELTISNCELEEIPLELGNLTSLDKLIISTPENSLNTTITLPISVDKLENLKSIFLSTNSNQFPIALLGLKNTLESMAIKDAIGSLPTEIGEFTALRTLTLNYCGLTNLPSEIEDLSTTLENLYLVGNNFDESTKQQIVNLLPNTKIYF